MFELGVLTFQEFMVNEPLPLVTIHQEVLDFLRDRDDVVVFGAQAVNAYVPEPRMTQDIDLLSTRAAEFVHELREHLSQRFHIAVRVRQVGEGRGYRLFQVRKAGDRHLVDVRAIEQLPATQRIARVLVMVPADLIASKVIAYTQRRGSPKSGTDWRDLAMSLLAFPELKYEQGAVVERLQAADADQAVLATWKELVAQDIQAADEDDEF
jgi:Nucleotidyl transferase AbiEii toxin, Type IV TA system